MEEGSEFLEKIKNEDKEKFPMFTSCCPGWVRFMKSQYPDMTDQLSSAKSPQQMFGAIAKSYYAKLLNTDPEKICSISIMPCIAKKQEAALPVMNSAGAGQDVDFVLTTREIVRLIRSEHIVVENLKEEEFDMPLGMGSGAGVIFGATGGVMEAALRSAYYLLTGRNPDPDSFSKVRGMDGWKEAEFNLAGKTIKVAVASGLGNTRRLMRAIRKERFSTISWRSWPVRADASEAEDSRSRTDKNLQEREAASCTGLTRSIICASPTKILPCRNAIRII